MKMGKALRKTAEGLPAVAEHDATCPVKIHQTVREREALFVVVSLVPVEGEFGCGAFFRASPSSASA